MPTAEMPGFIQRSKDHLKALIAKGGKTALSEFLPDEQKTMTAAAKASACKEFLACFFVHAADDNRYRGLKQALDNDHLMYKGAYPKTMVEALKLLKNYVVPGNKKHEAKNNKGEESGVAFVQRAKGLDRYCLLRVWEEGASNRGLP